MFYSVLFNDRRAEGFRDGVLEHPTRNVSILPSRLREPRGRERGRIAKRQRGWRTAGNKAV